VGDETRALDAENKISGGFGIPCLEAARALQRIKGAVDLDGVEGAARVFQLALLRVVWWIEDPAPRILSPAGNANA